MMFGWLKWHWFLVGLNKLRMKVARQENLFHHLEYKIKLLICSLELVRSQRVQSTFKFGL